MNRCEGDVMGGLDALDHVDPCLEGRDPCGADLVVRIDVLQWDIRLRGEEQPSGCKHLETNLHTHGAIVDQPTSMMMQSAGIANFGSMVPGFARADASSAFASAARRSNRPLTTRLHAPASYRVRRRWRMTLNFGPASTKSYERGRVLECVVQPC